MRETLDGTAEMFQTAWHALYGNSSPFAISPEKWVVAVFHFKDGEIEAWVTRNRKMGLTIVSFSIWENYS